VFFPELNKPARPAAARPCRTTRVGRRRARARCAQSDKDKIARNRRIGVHDRSCRVSHGWNELVDLAGCNAERPETRSVIANNRDANKRERGTGLIGAMLAPYFFHWLYSRYDYQ
jgi:hypothetical protein